VLLACALLLLLLLLLQHLIKARPLFGGQCLAKFLLRPLQFFAQARSHHLFGALLALLNNLIDPFMLFECKLQFASSTAQEIQPHAAGGLSLG